MDKVFIAILTVLFALIFGALIYGTMVYFLWNWLVPEIFNGPTITWIQGYGLSLLCCSLMPKMDIKKDK